MNGTTSLDPDTLRRAFACFPSGVTAVGAISDGLPVGTTASSFTSVSLDPPLVSVCFARTSRTWARLAGLPTLGVSVLADSHTDVARALSAREGDRFASVTWEATAGGGIFVHGAALRLECAVEDQIPAGDHIIVLMRVLGLRTDPDVAPMVFHGSRFRHLAPVT